MPLTFTGEKTADENRVRYKATNDEGKTVVVAVSHEALQDYDEDDVLAAASDKYDSNPKTPIDVTTGDLS